MAGCRHSSHGGVCNACFNDNMIAYDQEMRRQDRERRDLDDWNRRREAGDPTATTMPEALAADLASTVRSVVRRDERGAQPFKLFWYERVGVLVAAAFLLLTVIAETPTLVLLPLAAVGVLVWRRNRLATLRRAGGVAMNFARGEALRGPQQPPYTPMPEQYIAPPDHPTWQPPQQWGPTSQWAPPAAQQGYFDGPPAAPGLR